MCSQSQDRCDCDVSHCKLIIFIPLFKSGFTVSASCYHIRTTYVSESVPYLKVTQMGIFMEVKRSGLRSKVRYRSHMDKKDDSGYIRLLCEHSLVNLYKLQPQFLQYSASVAHLLQKSKYSPFRVFCSCNDYLFGIHLISSLDSLFTIKVFLSTQVLLTSYFLCTGSFLK